MLRSPRHLWVVRVLGAVTLALAVTLTWAYGPKSQGSGNNLLFAIPVGCLVLALYAMTLRTVLGPDRGRGDRLIAEAGWMSLGAVVIAGAFLFATFDAS
jgi:hypothetical protein